MIVDSSALVSVLLYEADHELMMSAMFSAARRRIAAPNFLETSMVFDGRMTAESYPRLEAAVSDLKILVVPYTTEMAGIAREACRRYGKNSRHPAKLNYGDCMAYSLAKLTGEPLLFKGNDFIHTDITPALA